ncbi:MAG: HD domain-containing protein [Filimonas sp.]|nr:HD domain-containing protein [Filimonas sp.]
MNYQDILQKAESYVRMFILNHPNDKIFYHTQDHVNAVVKAATNIANHYHLNDTDFFIVICAAYFHDIGYYNGENALGHEQRGADLATTFLQENNVPGEIIEQVQGCILATRMPQQPKSLVEKIICDADLFHLGTDDFEANNKLMHKEVDAWKGLHISKEHWRAGTIMLMQQHHYQTDYGQLLLTKTKEAHLQKLLKKQQENGEAVAAPTIPSKQPAAADTKEEHKKEDKKKEKIVRPDRGIETMFRISSTNHQRLSDMADNKAHILITVNSIIISVLLSILLRKLEEYPYLTIPVVLLLSVCVITMVISIRATRPTIPQGTFTKEDIETKKVNLLFFGNFYKMSLEEYTWGMLEVMNDRDYLYGSLIKDVYSQGVVLGKKYKLLRLAYNIFMFGIVISVVAFVGATLLYSDNSFLAK